MGVGTHAVCTLLGGAFAVLTGYLAYLLLGQFSWGLFAGTVTSLLFAEELLRAAVMRRYPVWIAVYLLTP
jgi:hypothetical protein